MDSGHLMEYYATTKGHILEKYIMPMGKCTQYIKWKADHRIEHNYNFINCMCV